ncbi:phosphotransferase family enzyme [Haloactinopolyspora alba]|uniref:Phosphotransferase family enzyme n=1 Tax=Haloactinopolyspora alba TaxID=648780 RepID=A0A2P8E7J7_9ACTN|nr:phosphotransferase [Haloactinopolyspora alba]PSL05439.1 phosphotransferase family enzyme [Haloactinopolyspora alba]
MPPRPRAVGERTAYTDVPARVRGWVDTCLGDEVVHATGHAGGMSPGCAARVRTRGGGTAFVKAVGPELNPDTPSLFRREIDVLEALEPAPYRPATIATYDDGNWVAVMLEDVDGRYPDLNDTGDFDAVWTTVLRQSAELTPAPAGLAVRTLPDVVARWSARWRSIAEDPAAYLPPWAAARFGRLDARVRTLRERLPVTSLCHWDVRDDNLLIRPDGTVVLLDWGMACLGPAWADLFFLSLSWVESPEFDARMRTVPQAPDDDVVTDLLLMFGAAQAWTARQPARPGLPAMPEFCRRDAERMFAGARRRLDAAFTLPRATMPPRARGR